MAANSPSVLTFKQRLAFHEATARAGSVGVAGQKHPEQLGSSSGM
jgi:hypothetical protein